MSFLIAAARGRSASLAGAIEWSTAPIPEAAEQSDDENDKEDGAEHGLPSADDQSGNACKPIRFLSREATPIWTPLFRARVLNLAPAARSPDL
jgi:hypothetical protein